MQSACMPIRLTRAETAISSSCRRPKCRPISQRAIQYQHFSSTRRRRTDSVAAPPIDFTSAPPSITPESLESARIIPASPSYFTAKPTFTDALINLQSLLRTYQTLPTVAPGTAPRVAWRPLAQYRSLIGEDVKAAKYSKILAILNRLNNINPALMPQAITDAMVPYKRDVNPFLNRATPIHVDEYGRALGLGRRKSSTATVLLVEGTGEVMINNDPLHVRFPRIHDRESALWALKTTQRLDKYNVWAVVRGGGTTGQAEALALAVAKALLVHEPALKPALRRAGCVTRDPRRVERKKPGRLKARKMPTWVKR